MSRSSEEVLLIVGHVKHKKTEGSLYMMGTRLAWMQDSKNTFSITHNYADIRVQKISPDTKEKVQLQILLHDGGANTFQFVNPLGRQTQITDRESIKELLQQLLPKFRNRLNSELEQKNRLLQDDPELFQLYKDLVVSGIVTADEFWANRANVKQEKDAKEKTNQEVGISAAFLADIKPQTDGCNGLKYNLTVDIIESIFRTYPTVKKKYAESVPDKLTESEFWTRFFQSHYFHRDRINFSNKDLFADCAKQDERDIQQEIQKPVEDALVDLTQMTDSTVGEGYGMVKDNEKNTGNVANSCLLRRFNQHSTMVLRACSKGSQSGESGSSDNPGKTDSNVSINNVKNGSSASISSLAHIDSLSSIPRTGSSSSLASMQAEEEPPPVKKAKIREKNFYEDLGTRNTSRKGPSLKLTKMERYLHGPTPVMAAHYTSSEEMVQASHVVAQEVAGWQPRLTQVLSSGSAVNILGELSPGGALMTGCGHQSLSQLIPADMQQEIKNLYSALCELLRHFWACFPATTPSLEEKVGRMRTALERFQMAKLQPLKDRLIQNHYNLNVVSHLEEMLAAAYEKFHNWHRRRMSRK